MYYYLPPELPKYFDFQKKTNVLQYLRRHCKKSFDIRYHWALKVLLKATKI
jgi:hypothetical protein